MLDSTMARVQMHVQVEAQAHAGDEVDELLSDGDDDVLPLSSTPNVTNVYVGRRCSHDVRSRCKYHLCLVNISDTETWVSFEPEGEYQALTPQRVQPMHLVCMEVPIGGRGQNRMSINMITNDVVEQRLVEFDSAPQEGHIIAQKFAVLLSRPMGARTTCLALGSQIFNDSPELNMCASTYIAPILQHFQPHSTIRGVWMHQKQLVVVNCESQKATFITSVRLIETDIPQRFNVDPLWSRISLVRPYPDNRPQAVFVLTGKINVDIDAPRNSTLEMAVQFRQDGTTPVQSVFSRCILQMQRPSISPLPVKPPILPTVDHTRALTSTATGTLRLIQLGPFVFGLRLPWLQ
jgi:hypothetical protein